MRPINTRLNSLLKKARVKRKISQQVLGEYLGYVSGHQYVSNWERGASPPPIHKLKYISAFLDVSYKSITDAYLADKEEEIKIALWGKGK